MMPSDTAMSPVHPFPTRTVIRQQPNGWWGVTAHRLNAKGQTIFATQHFETYAKAMAEAPALTREVAQ